jgi:thiosulfate/3-mercaptopyruvate sulfurtransferase
VTSPAYTTLISPGDLRPQVGRKDWVIVDCRFSLPDPPAGRRAYAENHIPGAVYAHLAEDLSGPVVAGKTGRHPLPDPGVLAKRFSDWGIDRSTQVVAYDASGGAMAGRLWWLLRWLGHDRVAVLDGGWQAWVTEGHPVTAVPPVVERRSFVMALRPGLVADATAVDRARADRKSKVLDARAAERFRGENETIDPVAGHIPGAISAPYAENLGADGRFKSPEDLRRHFTGLTGQTPADRIICYCGSGVTAVHDIIALAHAGLGQALLYPGSWSEWITDPRRPVAKGAK